MRANDRPGENVHGTREDRIPLLRRVLVDERRAGGPVTGARHEFARGAPGLSRQGEPGVPEVMHVELPQPDAAGRFPPGVAERVSGDGLPVPAGNMGDFGNPVVLARCASTSAAMLGGSTTVRASPVFVGVMVP